MAARSTFTRTSGSVITSAWANSLRDHIVPYSGADDVSTEGMLSVNTASDRVLVHDGTAARILSQYGAWSTWTPTVTQTGGATVTVTHAVFVRLGRLCVGNFRLSVTASPPVGGAITVSPPVTAARDSATIGEGYIFDTSAGLHYTGFLFSATTTTIDFRQHGTGTAIDNRLGIAGFTGLLAAGDGLGGYFMYETVA